MASMGKIWSGGFWDASHVFWWWHSQGLHARYSWLIIFLERPAMLLQVYITSPKLSTILIFRPCNLPPESLRGSGKLFWIWPISLLIIHMDIILFLFKTISQPYLNWVICWASSIYFCFKMDRWSRWRSGKSYLPRVFWRHHCNWGEQLFELVPIIISAGHNWNTWALWCTSCWEWLQSNRWA